MSLFWVDLRCEHGGLVNRSESLFQVLLGMSESIIEPLDVLERDVGRRHVAS
jgi:hypothetical protein